MKEVLEHNEDYPVQVLAATKDKGTMMFSVGSWEWGPISKRHRPVFWYIDYDSSRKKRYRQYAIMWSV